MQDIQSFLTESHYTAFGTEQPFEPLQTGLTIINAFQNGFDLSAAEIVLVGCDAGGDNQFKGAADAIRKQLYRLYNWHTSVKLADMGNIRVGATPEDTLAALRTVLHELHLAGKTAVVLGGGHDLTLQQYKAFKQSGKIIDATVADMLIDLDEKETVTDRSFLMDMLTEQPNFVRHYNHIGFQSYYAQPQMLETLDKLRFDFFRLGKVREQMEEMEPVLRSSHLFSFDMSAVRYSDAPANIHGSPNGFTGDEACMLTRYAGMSTLVSSFGIYGYNPQSDTRDMTAKLVAQMLWYFIDGFMIRKTEAPLSERDAFISFYITVDGHETVFLKSKKTNRWWIQLSEGNYLPCTYNDYIIAGKNDIPERWLREQERLA